ncbi:D-alanyl-D-alanine carboxypeptidase family protein [Acidisphaera sp. L21]|jgi:D-alanyl-D-alanine carboxypeptidase (penicillin-binding protein 5/6)|uniref:D-alanyl-D-alanine carboxypeptidase family protein n=1 Tax=Acidisphaera sp. L21 TaxID=1641851 RepID=UPI00131B6107|nr:D-alanyl-D-alanine carboxypeptidase family protein [Acidisphaera sp. L21]
MTQSLTRRILLATSSALVATPALAQRRAPRAGRGKASAEPVPTGNPAQTPLGPIDTAAKYAIVVDYNTGATLLDKDADVQQPPSSMTKLMTAYIVYGMLKIGRLKLDQELPVSDKAWRMQGSKMFVPQGGSVKVEDLIRGMIIQSGNDACIVLAEAIAGSEDQFVDQMNAHAKDLGMTNTHYANCTGWPDATQHMSMRDIATLTAHIIHDYPEYYHYDKETSFKYNGINQENRNSLVVKGLADGLKTGHTDAGGYGLVGSADRGGRRVILVVNGLTSMHARAEESEKLLEWSFREFENVTLFRAGDTVETIKVWLGTEPTVPLVGGRDLTITMPKQWRNTAKIEVQYNAPVEAPIGRGDTLGKLVVSGQGVPAMQVPLLAGADVPRKGLPGRALAVLGHYVLGS